MFRVLPVGAPSFQEADLAVPRIQTCYCGGALGVRAQNAAGDDVKHPRDLLRNRGTAKQFASFCWLSGDYGKHTGVPGRALGVVLAPHCHPTTRTTPFQQHTSAEPWHPAALCAASCTHAGKTQPLPEARPFACTSPSVCS